MTGVIDRPEARWPSLPPGWRVVRADSVFFYRRDVVAAESLAGKEVVHYSIPALSETGKPAVEEGGAIASSKFRLRGDEVLVSKLNPRKAHIFLPEVHHGMAVCSTEFVPLVPKEGIDRRYGYYLYLSTPVRDRISAVVQSATRSHQRANPDHIYKVWIPVAPLSEQRTIADFLDEKTAAIDALIAKKERLIDLIEEKRQAAITRAVTKGLNPDMPMKDSGVEWLGEVPAHWEVAPLYSKYSLQLGKMLSPEAVAGGLPAPYLRNANVQWGRLILDDLREMSFSRADRYRFALRPGDLLVCEGGEVGRTAMWRGELAECFYQKAIHRLRAVGRDIPSFFMFVMRAAAHRGVFLAEGNQSTIIHLTAEKLRRHRFPFPPPSEQSRIAEYLQRKMIACDALVGTERRIIERLQEYRRTLISAAVTGQIDVRSRSTHADRVLEEALA